MTPAVTELVNTLDPASLAVIGAMWFRVRRRLRRIEKHVEGVGPDSQSP